MGYECFEVEESDHIAHVRLSRGEQLNTMIPAFWSELHGSKEAINYSRDHTVEDSLRHIALWQSGMLHPQDLAESFAALSEGRPPAYEDLPEVRRGL